MGVQKEKWVIVGLGKTGFSCAKHLAHLNLPFAITDNREAPPEYPALAALYPSVEIKIGQFDVALMQSATELVVSQGIDFNEPSIVYCREQGIPIIGDIELFARTRKAPTIAITGSNAKSTVTSLVGHMAQQSQWDVRIGGNLGIPALDLLNSHEPELYVLEVSNFQLETTYSLAADVACILNITPDHMDRYQHFNDYVAAKHRIYQQCKKAVINRDDPLTWIADYQRVETISFGQSTPHQHEFGLREVQGEWYLAYGEENLLSVNKLTIMGQQNWLNALAALALGSAVGLPMASMLTALQTFTGLAHRCERVIEYNGISWYNDSKGTNVGATLAAIEGIGRQIDGKVILIAGGLAKNADFSPLIPAVNRYVKTMILFGQDASKIEHALRDGAAQLIQVKDLHQAVTLANQEATTGDAVLLSPACASFDMFKNFEHRGEVFCQTVRELLNGPS